MVRQRVSAALAECTESGAALERAAAGVELRVHAQARRVADKLRHELAALRDAHTLRHQR